MSKESILKDYLELLPNGDLKNTKSGRVIKQSLHKSGRYVIGLLGRQWKVHRVVWTLLKGDIPDGMVVDHIDGDPKNNSIDNLRLATNGQNQHNRRVNKSKVRGLPKGVCWAESKKAYLCRVHLDYKVHQKWCSTLEEATEWVKEKRRELHGEFYCD